MGGLRSLGGGVWRAIDRVFDALSVRPLGLIVFAGSLVLLVYLELGVAASIRADAVAWAPRVDHPARVASYVANVYVAPGDHVDAGAPMVDLSPHFIDREGGVTLDDCEHVSQQISAFLDVEDPMRKPIDVSGVIDALAPKSIVRRGLGDPRPDVNDGPRAIVLRSRPRDGEHTPKRRRRRRRRANDPPE